MSAVLAERGQQVIPEQTPDQRVENFMKYHLKKFGGLVPQDLLTLQNERGKLHVKKNTDGISTEVEISPSGNEINIMLVITSRSARTHVSGKISQDSWRFQDAKYFDNPHVPIFVKGQEALLKASGEFGTALPLGPEDFDRGIRPITPSEITETV